MKTLIKYLAFAAMILSLPAFATSVDSTEDLKDGGFFKRVFTPGTLGKKLPGDLIVITKPEVVFRNIAKNTAPKGADICGPGKYEDGAWIKESVNIQDYNGDIGNPKDGEIILLSYSACEPDYSGSIAIFHPPQAKEWYVQRTFSRSVVFARTYGQSSEGQNTMMVVGVGRWAGNGQVPTAYSFDLEQDHDTHLVTVTGMRELKDSDQ